MSNTNLIHTNTSRFPFPRRVIVIGVLIWILIAGGWSLYLLSGHKSFLLTSNIHHGYGYTSTSTSTFVSATTNTDSNDALNNKHLRPLSTNTMNHKDIITPNEETINEILETNNKLHTLQRNLAIKENEILQLKAQLTKLDNDLKHYKSINKELILEQEKHQIQQRQQADKEKKSLIVPGASLSTENKNNQIIIDTLKSSSSLISSSTKSTTLISPTISHLLHLLHAYIFPHPSSQNAARTAWIRGMLDWHNLVPDVYGIKDNDEATLVIQRLRREKAKEDLLELLNNWKAPRSLPVILNTNPESQNNGIVHFSYQDLQSEINHYITELIPSIKTITKYSTTSEIDKLSSILSNTTIINKITQTLRIDGDNIDDYRVPEKDYGPLGKMMACRKIRDPCLLHISARACIDDEYCGWCSKTSVCVDRSMGYWPEKQAGNKVPLCTEPLLVTAKSVPDEYIRRKQLENPEINKADIKVQLFQPKNSDRSVATRSVHPSSCSFIITRRRPMVLAFNNGNSKMAFHFFTETAPVWLGTVKQNHGSDYLNIDTYVPQATWNEFPQMITPFSDSCPRILEDISKRNTSICYENIEGPVLTKGLPIKKSSESSTSNNKEKKIQYGRKLLTISDFKLDNTEDTSIKEENDTPAKEEPIQEEQDTVSMEEKENSVVQKRSSIIASKLETNPTKEDLLSASSSSHSVETIPSVLTPQNVFGLADPDLVWMDPVTHIIINYNDGKADYTSSDSESSTSSNKLRAIFQFEPLTDTIYYGKRLGLAGLATLITYYGHLPYWNTKEGEAEIKRTLPGIAMNSESIATLANKLSTRLLRPATTFPELLLNLLLLQDEGNDDNTKPLVTFISRKNKRFIFNEADLIRITLALGARVNVIALESTPLYEQLTILRRTSILVGMHGSGLINSPIMRPGGVVLQLIPYGVKGASGFFQPTAINAGMDYIELTQSNRKKTVPHYHFLDSSHSKDYEGWFSASHGSEGSNQAVFFSFWINQDGYVDTEKFGRAIKSSLLQLEKNKQKEN